jgi:hypothetical protein
LPIFWIQLWISCDLQHSKLSLQVELMNLILASFATNK